MLAQGKEANAANQGAFRACEELVIEHLPAQPWIKKKCAQLSVATGLSASV